MNEKFSEPMKIAMSRMRQLQALRIQCDSMQCWLSQDIRLEAALIENIEAMSRLCGIHERMIIVRAMGGK